MNNLTSKGRVLGRFRSVHLFHKLTSFNSEIYMVVCLLALLTSREDLELSSQYALRTFVQVNLYCSAEPLWTRALQNRAFVVAENQTYTMRDSTLNGICSRGVIAIGNITQDFEPVPVPMCEWTAYNQADCSPAQAPIISAAFQTARRSGISFETTECVDRSLTRQICNRYDEFQSICIQSTNFRLTVSRIIGTIGLCMYPFLFWKLATSFLSLLLPFCWGLAMMTVAIQKECIFYSNMKLAWYVTGFTSAWLGFQVLVFGFIMSHGHNMLFLERYLKAKASGQTKEERALVENEKKQRRMSMKPGEVSEDEEPDMEMLNQPLLDKKNKRKTVLFDEGQS